MPTTRMLWLVSVWAVDNPSSDLTMRSKYPDSKPPQVVCFLGYSDFFLKNRCISKGRSRHYCTSKTNGLCSCVHSEPVGCIKSGINCPVIVKPCLKNIFFVLHVPKTKRWLLVRLRWKDGEANFTFTTCLPAIPESESLRKSGSLPRKRIKEPIDFGFVLRTVTLAFGGKILSLLNYCMNVRFRYSCDSCF